jgi:hypothetical protein
MGDYLDLLRELAALEPPVFAFGSVAEAILLDGRPGAHHGDLDVMIRRDEVAARLDQFAELGFGPFEVMYEPRPGLPLVLRADRGDVRLEPGVVDYDDRGRPYFALRPADRVVTVPLRPDLFDWPPTMVDGIVVHTLSPHAMLEIRAGLDASRAFSAPRPGDDGDRHARLRERFGG